MECPVVLDMVDGEKQGLALTTTHAGIPVVLENLYPLPKADLLVVRFHLGGMILLPLGGPLHGSFLVRVIPSCSRRLVALFTLGASATAAIVVIRIERTIRQTSLAGVALSHWHILSAVRTLAMYCLSDEGV